MASCNGNHGICLNYEKKSGTQSHATHSHHVTHAHPHIHRIHLFLHTSEPASASLSIKRLPHLPILLPIHSNNSIFIKHSAQHISKYMSCLLALPMSMHNVNAKTAKPHPRQLLCTGVFEYKRQHQLERTCLHASQQLKTWSRTCQLCMI